MTAAIERGEAVRHELESIGRSTKLLFQDTEMDRRDEFRKIIRERKGVFAVKLNAILDLHRLGHQLLDDWKKAVFRGEEKYSETAEKSLKDIFLIWNALASDFKQRAEFYGRHGLPVDLWQTADLNSFMQETARILKTWEKPGLSQAIALRTRKLSKAGIAKMKKLVASTKAE